MNGNDAEPIEPLWSSKEKAEKTVCDRFNIITFLCDLINLPKFIFQVKVL